MNVLGSTEGEHISPNNSYKIRGRQESIFLMRRRSGLWNPSTAREQSLNHLWRVIAFWGWIKAWSGKLRGGWKRKGTKSTESESPGEGRCSHDDSKWLWWAKVSKGPPPTAAFIPAGGRVSLHWCLTHSATSCCSVKVAIAPQLVVESQELSLTPDSGKRTDRPSLEEHHCRLRSNVREYRSAVWAAPWGAYGGPG